MALKHVHAKKKCMALENVCILMFFAAYCIPLHSIYPKDLQFQIFLTESVQRTTAEMEASIAAAVAFCLKYAPDRVGGGGRKNNASEV